VLFGCVDARGLNGALGRLQKLTHVPLAILAILLVCHAFDSDVFGYVVELAQQEVVSVFGDRYRQGLYRS